MNGYNPTYFIHNELCLFRCVCWHLGGGGAAMFGLSHTGDEIDLKLLKVDDDL